MIYGLIDWDACKAEPVNLVLTAWDLTVPFTFQHQTTHHLPWLIWRDSTSCSLSAELVMSTWTLSILGSQVIYFNYSRRKLWRNFERPLGELWGNSEETHRELSGNSEETHMELTRNPNGTLSELWWNFEGTFRNFQGNSKETHRKPWWNSDGTLKEFPWNSNVTSF